MARSPRHITILHAGPGHISFVRGEATGAVVAQAAERGPWNLEDGSLATALGDFAKRHELLDDRIFFVLPRHEAAVRILELPSQDPLELGGMVHLGAEEIVPFPLDELQTSYCLLSPIEGGSSRVLAVVVRKAVIEAYLDALRAARLDFEQVFLSTSCILTALKREGTTSCAATHVGPGGLEVALLRDGQMIFGRGVAVSVSIENDRFSESSLDEIAAEVRASLSASRRESSDGSAPGELLVSATGADAGPIAEALGAALDQPAHVYRHDGANSLVDAGAMATVQGDRSYFIDLTPESELIRRYASVARARGLRVAVAVLIAAIAAGAVYAQAVTQRGAYLRELDARADDLRPLAQTLRTKRQQLRLIEEQVQRSASPIVVLATIASLAPEAGLNFTRFSYDQRQGVTVNGSATEPKLFDGLIDSLRGPGAAAIPQFARAQELYRTARVERNQNVWDFAVTIPFTEASAND